ncbi:hypothetical protein GCM10010156_15810 [Planobispora rosea]|uniref:Lipoprotein n=1 Tax=Planobispora rosea TaxID=35762 RepID=A0A8J3S0V2_PLARO|nr:hypothetical protein [Planobispora rosea]GGS58070.1 hypothetical protein GCM10010156_15810 [Planobispora rosea]GIH84810.1 hypothetical protein Pro02_32180 [Planobispora rosea]
MKRWIAVLVVVLAVPVAVAGSGASASAEPAPAGPVDALRRQLVEGRGVKMAKTFTATKNGEKADIRVAGVAEFGDGKVTATDMTHRSDFTGIAGSVRHLTFPGRGYVQDGASFQGKSWRLQENKEIRPRLDADWIELSDPAMLKAVLATARVKRPAGVYDGTRTTLYQGTITLGELYRAGSAGFPFGRDEKPSKTEAKAAVSWKLWLGGDQLVRRAWGTWGEPFSRSGDIRISYVVDVRLSGWGAKVDVVPPPADDVARL